MYQRLTNQGLLQLSMGPVPSAAHGPISFLLDTDGETVFNSTFEVGWCHRGIEKTAEKISWVGFVPYTDRIDYLASIHCNLAYVQAVESIAKIEVSERTQIIRIIVSELSRISSHLYSLANIAKTVNSLAFYQYVLRDREKIFDLFEMLCGARLTHSYIRIGGVSHDVTDGFLERSAEFIKYLKPKFMEYTAVLFENYAFRRRLNNVGVITTHEAIDASLSGPNLRASGVNFDLRKDRPYSSYSKFDFQVPVINIDQAGAGGCYGRSYVRYLEISESLFIIEQALDQIPTGDFAISLPRVFKVPAGEFYSCVESPRGILGFYILSEGEKYPYRVKIRTPSFFTLNLFPNILRNTRLSDFPVIVSSLDILASEVDR